MKQISLLIILTNDLKLIRCKCHTAQKFSNADKTVRLSICQRFYQEIENDNDWVKSVWFTDEAHFYLNGIINSQNCRLWGKDVANEVNERLLYNDKCIVWRDLSANGIIGSLWF